MQLFSFFDLVFEVVPDLILIYLALMESLKWNFKKMLNRLLIRQSGETQLACVFPMSISPKNRMEKYRDFDHREDAPHFNSNHFENRSKITPAKVFRPYFSYNQPKIFSEHDFIPNRIFSILPFVGCGIF